MMTAEQLKNSILQLALQGRLVEQSTEDESAQKLLEQIRTAKRALIKAGTVPKDKKMEEVSEDDQLFDLPENWIWTRMGELFQHNTGKALNGTNKDGEVLTYITTSNLYWNRFELDNLKSMPFTESEVEKCTVTKGDLLVCEGGDYGRAAIWNYDFDMRIQNHVHRLRAYLPLCTEYFYYVINFLKGTGLIKGKGIAIQGLSSGALHNLAVPLPPLEEQKRIVAKIEELMPFVEQYAKASTRLNTLNASFPDQMKKSILQQAVMGKLVPQNPNDEPASVLLKKIAEEKQKLIKEGKIKKQKALPAITEDEIPFDIPESWAWCYVNDIAFVTKLAGFEYTKNIAPNLQSEGIPLFKGKNVRNGKLVTEFESFIPENVSDELPRSQLNRKCLLTPYVGTIGNIAIFDGTFRAHLGSNVGKIEILNYSETYVTEEYVLYYLRSPEGYRQLTKYKKATAQESISIDAIRNIIIAIPPLEEQIRIVANIEKAFEMIETIK